MIHAAAIFVFCLCPLASVIGWAWTIAISIWVAVWWFLVEFGELLEQWEDDANW